MVSALAALCKCTCLCDAALACDIMPVLSKYAKQWIVFLKKGASPSASHDNITMQIAQHCHKRYVKTGSIGRQQGSERLTLRRCTLLPFFRQLQDLYPVI